MIPTIPVYQLLPVLLLVQVDMEARQVVDRHVIGGDCVELSRHQGVHLLGDLLLVLGVSALLAGTIAGQIVSLIPEIFWW